MRIGLILISIFLPCICLGEGLATRNFAFHGPTCIASFCFGEKTIKKADIVKRYGKGHYKGGKFSYHCYKDSKQALFVHFKMHHDSSGEVSEILVSDVANCVLNNKPKAVNTLRPFETLSTREGIMIGDDYQKVVDTYGNPELIEEGSGLDVIGLDYETAMKSAPLGDKVLIYNSPKGQLMQASFYIRKGKVSAIQISISE